MKRALISNLVAQQRRRQCSSSSRGETFLGSLQLSSRSLGGAGRACLGVVERKYPHLPLGLPHSFRWHSTLAAAAEMPEEDFEPPPPDDDDDERNKRGSRLEALRERLRQEDSPSINGSSDPSSSPSSASVQMTFTQAKAAAAANPKTDSPSSQQQDDDLQRVLAQLPTTPVEKDHVLMDSYARKHTYLRLSLTERCNLRCTYCMPEQGVPLQPADHLLTTAELLQLATYFRQAGVTKFRLTGGEPTLRADLVDIVAGLAALQPESVGMTTNGITLGRHLDAGLLEAGLTNINISLDTLQPTKFQTLTRRPAALLDKVMESIEHAMQLQVPSLKINCVVMRGVNDDEVADFCRLAAHTEKFFSSASSSKTELQVRFIEYMPFSENGWNWDKCVPYQELLDRIHDENNDNDGSLQLTALPSRDPHDTTKWYTTDIMDDDNSSKPPRRNVGFITSMSSHFCAGCNRLRLTADGQIKVCLFDGTTEVSLRDAIRAMNNNNQTNGINGHSADTTDAAASQEEQQQAVTHAQLDQLVHLALSRKHFSLGGHKDPQDIMKDASNNRPMTLIGG